MALAGGNMSDVVRRGQAVHRTAGPWTPTIHRLLDHLRARGATWLPRPLGLDEQGREVLTYLPGTVPAYPMPSWVWSEEVLVDAARRLAQVHQASAGFDTTEAVWQLSAHLPAEVVCLNDVAPYNMVFDDAHQLTGFIDLDTASPGPRVWDLAYLAYRIAPLAPAQDIGTGLPSLAVRGHRLGLLCQAYADAGDHVAISAQTVLRTVMPRLEELASFAAAQAAAGAAQVADHAQGYLDDARWVKEHFEELLPTAFVATGDEELAEIALQGGSHSEAARVGQTVRRVPRPWSSSVQDLLRHVEDEGFLGAPRALGFDEQGREVLTYVPGEVGVGLPEAAEGHVDDAGHWVWRDDVLKSLGSLLREYHDAAVAFPWAGRTWQVAVQEPVETICHNDLAPANVIFRAGLPAALIDWEAAAPGPRAHDLGFAAWRWVPFWPDERCRAAGLPTGTAEKARRLRLLLDAYGVAADVAFMQQAIDRMTQFRDHLMELVDAGSEWEVRLAQRGVLAELEAEIAWVTDHAADLVIPV